MGARLSEFFTMNANLIFLFGERGLGVGAGG